MEGGTLLRMCLRGACWVELGLYARFPQGLREGEDPLLRAWALVITPCLLRAKAARCSPCKQRWMHRKTTGVGAEPVSVSCSRVSGGLCPSPAASSLCMHHTRLSSQGERSFLIAFEQFHPQKSTMGPIPSPFTPSSLPDEMG